MDKVKKADWKIRFAVVMIIIAFIFFASRMLYLGDSEEVVSYLWKQIGFIPVNILLVAFLIDGIISKKEHEAILEKVDMIMGTFFTKLGNDLVHMISTASVNTVSTHALKNIRDWDDKDYENKLKEFKEHPVEFDTALKGEERAKFLNEIQDILSENRDFIINLINNPNLLKKGEFSGLMIALLHLDEELARRGDLNNVSDTDFAHLKGDIARVYSHLIYEWIYYLRYLNKFYPYMISLAIRTNPFDCDADVHINE
ncbi:MAG: hypothetical protein Q4P18_01900 [Methanobrevibacter sp.]|uniref:hypothetical protein n=1 Tax=Methanobrevibacter sp. TaxID=66852 RepID=UPI0026E06806|nr:hypothetical protein [Methanobrevibacter sp.]MDO5848264.1 hypothetical protein [Methanobrevibacter sp.]